MKTIAFLGAKPIGYKCLKFLIDNGSSLDCKIEAVFSNNNSRFGNEQSLKELAIENNIFYSDELNDLLHLKEKVDFIISVQYHLILKPEHILQAKGIAINLHMAPLPEYRGCNQFSFAIYNQDKIFGTTIHQIEPGIDSGKIIAERRFKMDDIKYVKELYDKTFVESIFLFEENIKNILDGNYSAISQEDLLAERGSQFHLRKDLIKLKQIDLGEQAEEVYRKIRATAMPGFEPPFTIINNEKIYLIPERMYNR